MRVDRLARLLSFLMGLQIFIFGGGLAHAAGGTNVVVGSGSTSSCPVGTHAVNSDAQLIPNSNQFALTVGDNCVPDSNTPSVTIDTPDPVSFKFNATNSQPVSIGGTCSHPTVAVSWNIPEATQSGSTTCLASNRWEVSGLDLSGQVGINSINVSATHSTPDGDASDSKTYVYDIVAPVLSLSASSASIVTGSSFDPISYISEASDNLDGPNTLDLVSNVIITGAPSDTNTPGTFDLAYSLSDSAGNSVGPLSFSLIIHDPDSVSITHPILSTILNAANSANMTVDGTCNMSGQNVSLTISGIDVQDQSGTPVGQPILAACNGTNWSVPNLDLSHPTNSGINSTTMIATFGSDSDSKTYVYDITPPVLQLSASATDVEQGEIFGTAEARTFIQTASDNYDSGDLSGNVVISGAPGNTSGRNVGDIIDVTFTLQDQAGNISTAHLSVHIIAPTQYYLSMIDPLDGTVGIPLHHSSFQWALSGPDTSNVLYDYTLAKGDSCDIDIAAHQIDFNGTTFTLTSVDLIETSNYILCVSAKRSGAELISKSFHFVTQSRDIPRLALDIDPSEDNQPSGQSQIILSSSQGESGSTAVFYSKDDSGVLTEISRTTIAIDGTASIVYDLPDLGQIPLYTFVSKMIRNDILGPVSNEVHYRFDPSLALDTPVIVYLDSGTDYKTATDQVGKLKWRPVAGADSYKVWRRIGNELCVQSDDHSCYQGSKPFSLYQSLDEAYINSHLHNGYIELTAADVGHIPDPSDSGISYFVTAHNGSLSSRRSNSLSYLDSIQVRNFTTDSDGNLLSPTLRIVQNAYSATVYACGVNNFDLDNSADLISRLQIQARGDNSNCDFDFDSNAIELTPQIFDSLSIVDVPNELIDDCTPVARINDLNPETNYCVATCFEDISSNGNPVCAPRKSDFETNPDDQAPDFAGIDQLIAHPNGNALVARWNPATADAPIEEPLIQYEVSCTSEFDDLGQPRFGDIAQIVNADSTEATISDLKTATKYACKVAAVDRFGNKNEGVGFKEESTLDNNPHIVATRMNFIVDDHTRTADRRAQVCLNTYDRNIPNGDRVSVSGMSFENRSSGNSNDNGYRAIQSIDLQNLIVDDAATFYSLSGSPSQEDCFVLNLKDIVTSGDYQGLNYIIEVSDSNGNKSQMPGFASLNEGLSARTEMFGNRLSAGCSLTTVSEQKNFLWILLSVIGFGLFSTTVFRKKKVKA